MNGLFNKRLQWIIGTAFMVSILLAIVLIAVITLLRETERGVESADVAADVVELVTVKIRNSAALADHFAALDYHWPPQGALPPTGLRSLPRDLHEQTVDARKSLFFRALAPIIATENRRIAGQRQQVLRALEKLQADPSNASAEIALLEIAEDYGMDAHGRVEEIRHELLRRVDIIPPGLALAQAANESAWGTSRFAREANNLFGMWTWDESKGLKPKNRSEEANHYVRIFTDLRSAVRNYMHTLNTGSAYSDLRNIRAAARRQGNPPSATGMAAGLKRYSQRGEDYVNEIRAMIRYNGLEQWPRFELRDDTEAVASDESRDD